MPSSLEGALLPADALLPHAARAGNQVIAFHLRQLAHTHDLKVFGLLVDPTGLPEATRKAMAARLAAAQQQ